MQAAENGATSFERQEYALKRDMSKLFLGKTSNNKGYFLIKSHRIEEWTIKRKVHIQKGGMQDR